MVSATCYRMEGGRGTWQSQALAGRSTRTGQVQAPELGLEDALGPVVCTHLLTSLLIPFLAPLYSLYLECLPVVLPLRPLPPKTWGRVIISYALLGPSSHRVSSPSPILEFSALCAKLGLPCLESRHPQMAAPTQILSGTLSPALQLTVSPDIPLALCGSIFSPVKWESYPYFIALW